jgi:hypothetical protein
LRGFFSTVYLSKKANWDPASSELRLTLTAYSTAKGTLQTLRDSALVVTPNTLKENE